MRIRQLLRPYVLTGGARNGGVIKIA